MPSFDFTSPDGKSYSVQGPDGATPEQAFQMLQQHIGGDAPQVGMGEDAAKSIGAGLGTATISALGGVGDIRSLLSQGVDAAGSKLGFDPSMLKSAAGRAFPALNSAPTSADVRSTITDPIVSPDYKPQYWTGDLGKKVAEFGPGMLLGGPEGAGARFLTNVAAPAVGSTIGESIGGPLGSIAGALAGGVGATSAAQKFKAMAAARQAERAIPSTEDTLKTASNQFNQARDMNVVVKPDFATNAAADMRTAIKNYDPNVIKDVHAAADRLEALGSTKPPSISPAQRLQAEMNWEPTPAAKAPNPVLMNDAEHVRKQLVSLKTSPDASVRSAAKEAIKSLQQSQMGLTAADTLSGDAGAFTRLTKDAIGNWAVGKRSNTIMGKVDLADLNAGTAGSGANQDNALRQAIKQLARPMNNTNVPVAKKLGFSADEIAAIKNAATGTAVGNTARYVGKYAPTGIVSAAGGAGLGHLVGGPVGAAIPVVGYIAKKIGDLSTKRAVSAVDSLVRSKSPLAAHVAAQLPPQIIQQMPAKSQRLLQSLILADPVLSQQASQPVSQSNAYQPR